MTGITVTLLLWPKSLSIVGTKKHVTFEKLGVILAAPPENIPHVGLTEFAQAMSHYPDCKVPGDAVKAYRNYYHYAKDFAKWEWKRPAPDWWEGYKGA